MNQRSRAITRVLLSATLATAAVCAPAAAAPPPDRIHYQGVLRDAGGTPLDGSYDMVFRFFDADVGGDEILVDTHDAGGGNAVTVSGGLFGVDLGAGVTSDGTGPGIYASLTEVFRDHGATWLAIEIGGELLSPRIEVISAAYALNADHLDGMDSSAFVTVETDPQVGALSPSAIPRWDGTALVEGAIRDLGSMVGIGTETPNATLDVSGTINALTEYRLGGGSFLKAPGGNHCIGTATCQSITTGFGSVMVGSEAGYANTVGTHNTFLGGQSGKDNVDGSQNTFVGSLAGSNNTSGGSNVFLGYLAGFSNGTGQRNTYLGWRTGIGSFSGSGNVYIGYNAGANQGGSDQLFIANSDTVDPLIYGNFATNRLGIGTSSPSATLEVNGDVNVGGEFSFGSSGQTFRYDSAGVQFRFSDRVKLDRELFVDDRLYLGTTGEFMNWAGNAFYLSDDLKLDAVFIEGRDAGNFEVISRSSLHLVGDSEVRTMVDDDNTGSTATAEWFHDGSFANSSKLAELQEDGDLRIRGTLSQSVAFDLAETFLASEPLEAGDVVRLDPGRAGAVRKSTGRDDPLVLGVVSSKPGLLLGSAPFDAAALHEVWGEDIATEFETARTRLREGVTARRPEIRLRLERVQALEARVLEEASGKTESRANADLVAERAELEAKLESLSLESFFAERFVPVALAGRVPVAVDATLGPIEPGDALAPGPIPGTAVRADDSAPVIGIALEGLSEGRDHLVAFVQRSSATIAPGNTRAEREFTEALRRRTPDPETGTQRMPGNLQIALDAGADERSRFSIFRDGDDERLAAELLRLDEHGDLFLKGAVRPASMDVAEYFLVSETVEAGDVLAIDPGRSGHYLASRKAADPTVVGVVAAAPGVLLGSGVERIARTDPAAAIELERARAVGDTALEAEIWAGLTRRFERQHAPVALSGTVDVKVDAGFGAIRAGDLLTASPTRGHAMRADDPGAGTILGKALEPLEAGTGRVRMLVMLR